MFHVKHVLPVLFAVGCGTDPGSSPAPSTAAVGETTPTVEARAHEGALWVADKASLPACDTPGLLAYVASDRAFRYCETDGAWHDVDLKGEKGEDGARGEAGPQGAPGVAGATGAVGPKGDTGPQGPKGDKGETGATGPTGPQGVAGTDGAQGATGVAGQDGQLVTDSMWYDPIGARYWTFGALTVTTHAAAVAACQGTGWGLPSEADWLTAARRGLSTVSAIDTGAVWLDDGRLMKADGTTAAGAARIYCRETP